MKKKIGILTQPLTNNYGGILQNYALHKVLKQNNLHPCTINRQFPPASKRILFASVLKRAIDKYILRKDVVVRVWETKKEEAVINQHFNRFIDENINTTSPIYCNLDSHLIKKYACNAYIVGSDQVWRPQYSPCITNYFFDFLDRQQNVKKIAYAVSFGVDNWEFTVEQTEECSNLAKQFDAISVREDSAIDLCKQHFEVEATHVLDPTMLLTKEDYIHLTELDNTPKKENILFSYTLDKSDDKISFIRQIAKKYKLQSVSGMPSNSFALKKSKKDLSDCIFPSITEWIAGFRDARFVVTDSFHGTVFAILFNKPFVVFANEKRGNARMNSLLKMFNLEDRLVTSTDFDSNLFELNYSGINNILEKERDKSITFLLNALKL